MRECPTCKMSNLSSATACAYCQAVLPAESVPEAFTMPELEAVVPAAAPEPVAVPEPLATPEPPKPPRPPRRVEAIVGEPEPLPPYPSAEAPEPRPETTGPSTLVADAAAAFTALLKGGLAYICWLMWGTVVMLLTSTAQEVGAIFGVITLALYGFTAYRFFNPPPELRRRREIVWFAAGFFPFGLFLLLAGAQSPDEALVAGANHWILTVAAVTLIGAYRMRRR